MPTENVYLDTKLIGEISGVFIIKSYQRGYRWDVQVKTLLDDIWENGDKSYCLQPVVVRNDGDRYELIDGQQRLTTLYILLKFIQKEFFPRMRICFSLEYENRAKSKDFLENMDKELADSNIDFYFMQKAYDVIDEWFSGDQDGGQYKATKIYSSLCEKVKVIWYEVDESTDPIALFTRLNIGRIPLTNAELIKALFLNRNEAIDKDKQIEISMQWDDIERRLHNERLWYFLNNSPLENYSTKIDLLFEAIADVKHSSKEKYATFFYFDKYKKEKIVMRNRQEDKLRVALDIWDEVRRKFLLLTEWYENHILYHKIGYLIATEVFNIQELMKASEGKTKDEFNDFLDMSIAKSIDIDEDRTYMVLSYENGTDQKTITRILLLFNVLSVANSGGKQWFPFDEYKISSWSLEHIHAQNSEGLNSKSAILDWLRKHKASLESVNDAGCYDALLDEVNALMEKCEDAQTKDSPVGETFKTLFPRIVSALTSREDNDENGERSSSDMHSLTNMALLKGNDNAALNNATFDVKRNIIIAMDKRGDFIPFCTRMVFLKYYSSSKGNQIHFWSPKDRSAYRESMNNVLAKYLDINKKRI